MNQYEYRVLNKHWHIISSDSKLSGVFKNGPKLVFKRQNNLCDLFVKSEFPSRKKARHSHSSSRKKKKKWIFFSVCTTCHMLFVVSLIEVITCFYLKFTLLYIGIMPDEDLWVEMLLLLLTNSFRAAIFSVRTSFLPFVIITQLSCTWAQSGCLGCAHLFAIFDSPIWI